MTSPPSSGALGKHEGQLKQEAPPIHLFILLHVGFTRRRSGATNVLSALNSFPLILCGKTKYSIKEMIGSLKYRPKARVCA